MFGMQQKEKQLTLQAAQYLQYAHPKVMYHIDVGSGVKLHKSQGVQHKRLNPVRGHPDIVVYEARRGFNGLFIELKAEGRSPYLKNGGLSKNVHVREQAEYHRRLEDRGFKCCFAVGFDDFVAKIEAYLS